MKTKATILTFLFYTVVSGHEEEEDTSRLAISGVSRRFRWFHRLGSPLATPADVSVEVVSQPRSIATSESTITMPITLYSILYVSLTLNSLLLHTFR
jgi:hypothetical protein